MALAALATGGRVSRAGGAFVVRPPFIVVETAVDGTGWIDPGRVSVVVPELSVATTPVCLSSESGNSCRRTGSWPVWKREATAGVFRNAPGTGRTGVVCGNDMAESDSAVGRRLGSL